MTKRASKRSASTVPANDPAECTPRSVRSYTLRGIPGSASGARRLLRTQLTAWELDQLADDAELLVSELVANAVTHTGNRIVHFVLARTAAVLRLSIEDASRTLPCQLTAEPGDESGRGLQIVAVLSDRWGASYTATGKIVWCELRLPRPR